MASRLAHSVITAKYPGICPTCRGPIAPGERVEWTSGAKASHVRCASGAGAQRTPPAQLDREIAEALAQPVTTGRALTVERVGRRSYIRGDTMAVRGVLKAGGAHWDPDAKAWWVGKHEDAVKLANDATGAPAEAAPKKRVTHCLYSGCGAHLDDYQIRHGHKFCSADCARDMKTGGQSGYFGGRWHQGDND